MQKFIPFSLKFYNTTRTPKKKNIQNNYRNLILLKNIQVRFTLPLVAGLLAVTQ
jgi:hypothetical protein